MTKEEIEELIGLAAGMGLYDDKNPGKRAVILGKAIKELQQEPCKNAISRQEMLKYFEGWKNKIKYYHPYAKNFDMPYEEAIQWVNELPPVNPNKWIPLKTRPMTDEESTFFRDWAEYGAELFDCPLPDDGQEVLVSWGGNVCIDTFVRDDRDGCYFEGVDIGDVEAWQPLPKPYEPQESEDKE